MMTDATADSDAQAHQELHCLYIRPSAKSVYPKISFLISQPKHMLYVVGAQKNRLILAPQTYAKIERYENIYNCRSNIWFSKPMSMLKR